MGAKERRKAFCARFGRTFMTPPIGLWRLHFNPWLKGAYGVECDAGRGTAKNVGQGSFQGLSRRRPGERDGRSRSQARQRGRIASGYSRERDSRRLFRVPGGQGRFRCRGSTKDEHPAPETTAEACKNGKPIRRHPGTGGGGANASGSVNGRRAAADDPAVGSGVKKKSKGWTPGRCTNSRDCFGRGWLPPRNNGHRSGGRRRKKKLMERAWHQR